MTAVLDSAAGLRRGRLRQWLTRRDIRIQIVFAAAVLAVLLAVIWTVAGNLQAISAKSGYAFLWQRASLEIGESLIPFASGDPYWRAFAVGILNTLKVAICGIVLSTVIGLVIALGQLSPSVIVARACRLYVEVVRNVPLLMQLIFWHTLLTRGLPRVRQPWQPIEGVLLTNRGLYFPLPVLDGAAKALLPALLAGLVVVAAGALWRARFGGPANRYQLAVLGLASALVVFVALGLPLTVDWPARAGFNIAGGLAVSPEFAAMLLGLAIYTGAFNAEIIRAGIQGVAAGQMEAGLALGLSRRRVMRLVIVPQAVRLIVPPITNSYLNLTKESSLGVAIGYPELVRVANITLTETGQAIECVSIIMLVYLSLSLITSALLNWFNARSAGVRP